MIGLVPPAGESFPLKRFPDTRESSSAVYAQSEISSEHWRITPGVRLDRFSLSNLSGGEKAPVQLARALAQVARAESNPACTTPCDWLPAARWLLLDEPTAALYVQHQHQALTAVQRWAATPDTGAVAVPHDLNLTLRYCS